MSKTIHHSWEGKEKSLEKPLKLIKIDLNSPKIAKIVGILTKKDHKLLTLENKSSDCQFFEANTFFMKV